MRAVWLSSLLALVCAVACGPPGEKLDAFVLPSACGSCPICRGDQRCVGGAGTDHVATCFGRCVTDKDCYPGELCLAVVENGSQSLPLCIGPGRPTLCADAADAGAPPCTLAADRCSGDVLVSGYTDVRRHVCGYSFTRCTDGCDDGGAGGGDGGAGTGARCR